MKLIFWWASPENESDVLDGCLERGSHPRFVEWFLGDRATIIFPLPEKTEEDSYDPLRAIKVKIRIDNMFSSDMEDIDDASGDGAGDITSSTPAPVHDYLTNGACSPAFRLAYVVIYTLKRIRPLYLSNLPLVEWWKGWDP